jgi:HEPN superfamily RiboL-PSP-like protein
MAEKDIIKPVSFGYRLKRDSLIPYYLDLLSTKGNLKELIMVHKMAGFDQMVAEMASRAMVVMKEEDRQATIQTIKKNAEEMNRKEIESFMPILFNQAVVMTCTTFDVFLVDSLEVVTRKQPNILKGLIGKQEIDINQITDLGDYQNILGFLQTKALKKFDYGSIEDKIKALEKLGVDITGVFSFKHHNQDIQKRYPNAQELLVNVYTKRHGIVHANQLPLTTYGELEEITTFVDNLMLSFGIELGAHFRITTDWDLLLIGKADFLQKI